jgi:hypothetical protein
LVVQANGRVGIATQDLTGLLAVGNGHGTKLLVGNGAWANAGIITTGTAQGLDYTDVLVPGMQANAALFRINSLGNVGIATTNIDPAYRLSVNGKIRSKGLRVQTDSWADFVFADGYKLPKLGEVEAFIKAHKHLPDIPNTATVLKEGVDVGDLQTKLLQKIEELTLYAIAQEKKMEELQQQNNALQAMGTELQKLKEEIKWLKENLIPKK